MTDATLPLDLALSLSDAARRVAQRLDSSLVATRGLSFAEFRLLTALASRPGARASRVDLADATGLTASGVTRALKPMEALGVVSTVKSKRDARLVIAGLTPAGRDILNDAAGIVADAMRDIAGRAAASDADLEQAVALLTRLSR
jgi:DNA-binding MarR family transcriptional regulator